MTLDTSGNMVEAQKSYSEELWEKAEEVIPLRNQISQMIISQHWEQLAELGFSEQIIQIWQSCANNQSFLELVQTPTIITSFGHAEHPDVYKIIAAERLASFLKLAKESGIKLNLLNDLLDTAIRTDDFRPSARPFYLKGFFTGAQQIFNFGSSKLVEVITDLSNGIKFAEEDIGLIVAKLSSSALPKKEGFFSKKVYIEEVRERGSVLLNLLRNSVAGASSVFKASANFSNLITKALLLEAGEDSEYIENLINVCGTNLLSENASRCSLQGQLLRHVLSQYADNPVQLSCLLNTIDQPQRLGFILDEEEGTLVRRIVEMDSELILRIDGTLARSEEIGAIVPIGSSFDFLHLLTLNFHYGSEYGLREKLIAGFGIKENSPAQNLLSNLQLGKDRTQGAKGIIVDKPEKTARINYMSLPVLYLLFGAKRVLNWLRNPTEFPVLKNPNAENITAELVELIKK